MTATQKKAPAPSRGLWAVRCDDYTTKPTSRGSAQRLLELVEQAGHCQNRHEVVEVSG